MNRAASEVCDLARFLLAAEAEKREHGEEEAEVALRVFGQLRSYLTSLIGVAGFEAILTRALSLAKVECGWLGAVRVQADATFEGFHEAAQKQPTPAVAAGCAALLTALLGLLVAFIGEALTRQLMQDIWPEVQRYDRQAGLGETTA